MAKYRKKPVVIEAKEWDGSNFNDIQYFMDTNTKCTRTVEWDHAFENSLVIPTLEGDHRASVGDFIIIGIKGEAYPCKPDIFHATYEKVEEE